MAQDGHEDVGTFNLSKEPFRVGYFEGDNTIYIQAENQNEPTYMSFQEAELIIAALRVAISKVMGDE